MLKQLDFLTCQFSMRKFLRSVSKLTKAINRKSCKPYSCIHNEENPSDKRDDGNYIDWKTDIDC